MFENVCTLPLRADVLTTALHPTEPLLTVGLASGHIQTFHLPPVSTEHNGPAENGKGMIETVWETRRHKGGCRTIAYSHDGSAMYSAGNDGLIKHFNPLDGRVISKTAIPLYSGELDPPITLHVLNPQSLILGCDSGALHLYDLTDGMPSEKPFKTYHPHDDWVSSIVPLPPTEESTSGFSKQWVTTGGTTLAAVDWRRGVLKQSDDQEDELLCAAFIPGIGPRKKRNNGMVAVGSGSGVLTLWDKGSWDDQQERIIVDNARGGGESIDALVMVPEDMRVGKKLVVALGDGRLVVVNAVTRKVDLPTLRHDDTEGAISLGFDCHNRLISAGGKIVKVWQEILADSVTEAGDEDDSDNNKRPADSDDEEEDEEDGDSDDSDEPKQKRGKKRKLDKPKAPSEFSFPGLEEE